MSLPYQITKDEASVASAEQAPRAEVAGAGTRSPRPVTRGENPPNVFLDWVSFTWRPNPSVCKHDAEPALRVLQILRGYYARIDGVDLERGWLGYEQSMRLEVDDRQAGVVAWGGKSQGGTCYVSLSGYGCEWFSGS